MFSSILRPRWRSLPALALFALLAACGDDDVILQGEREPLGLAAQVDVGFENQALSISLPSPETVNAWTHPGGNALHRIPHSAFSTAPQQIWSADIGAGDTRRQRINAQPVVAEGRIFTVDAQGIVAATSTSGQALWRRDLTPANETGGAFSLGVLGGTSVGGSHGLSFGGGQLYVNSGFGEVHALDPATGDEIWVQDIDAQGGGSATYFDGRVYVAARDSVGWAINAETGRIEWQLIGTPSTSGYLGGAGPTVTDDLAIFPFPSGELLAVIRRGGLQRWTATVLGGRDGVAYAQISDIAAAPVVAGRRVYASNPAGRLVALDLDNGARIWTARDGALKTPVVAGGSIFIVSDQNVLTRINADTGERIWAVQLPLFEESNARRQKTIFAHNGPLLAGGQLWVASSDGGLRAYDPVSGAAGASLPITGGAATAPIVAGGVMYVVTKRGQLLAFR